MPKKEELEISISDTGEVTINVIGAKGKKCIDMTKDLEEALGVVKYFEKKTEYYEDEEKQSSEVSIKGEGSGE